MFNFIKKHKYQITFGKGSILVIEAKNAYSAVQIFLAGHPWSKESFTIKEIN